MVIQLETYATVSQEFLEDHDLGILGLSGLFEMCAGAKWSTSITFMETRDTSDRIYGSKRLWKLLRHVADVFQRIWNQQADRSLANCSHYLFFEEFFDRIQVRFALRKGLQHQLFHQNFCDKVSESSFHVAEVFFNRSNSFKHLIWLFFQKLDFTRVASSRTGVDGRWRQFSYWRSCFFLQEINSCDKDCHRSFHRRNLYTKIGSRGWFGVLRSKSHPTPPGASQKIISRWLWVPFPGKADFETSVTIVAEVFIE